MPSNSPLLRPVGWAILTVAVLLSAALGLLTTYVLAALAAAALVVLLATRTRPWVAGADTQLFAGAFAIIVLLFAITAKAPVDVALAINFIAFALYAPVAALFERLRGERAALLIAWLALGGVALAFAICLVQVYGFEFRRARGIFSDTIRFANTAVIASFLALMGLLAVKAWWRIVFLLAPLLAIGVVLLTGTRIAMVAFPVVALVALVLIVPGRWRLPTLVGLAVLFLAVGYGLTLEGNQRFLSIFNSVRQIVAGERIADRATRVRMGLYEGAWEAIKQSPLVGHGWQRLMSSVAPFLGPGTRDYAQRLVHLHNDFLSFGVAGGVVAMALYLALLVVPLILVATSPRDSQKSQRVLGAGTLVACYFTMGLTDTMLAFEMSTMSYTILMAAILRLCRDRGSGTG